jgi:hypothetical protein
MKAVLYIIPLIVGFGLGQGYKRHGRLPKALNILERHLTQYDDFCVNHMQYGLMPTDRFEFCSAANALAVLKLSIVTTFEHHPDVNVKHMYREAPITSSISIVKSTKED